MNFSGNTSFGNSNNKNYIRPAKLLILGLVAMTAVGFTVISAYNDSFAQKETNRTESSQSSNTVSNSSTKQGNPASMKSYAKLKADLESYIGKYKGTIGIHFISLTDGGEFGINDTAQIKAASTVKVPINLYLYEKVAQGKIKLSDTMTYTDDDYATGTGSIQYGETGRKFTIRELSRLSIEESDNVATNMLIRLLGKSNYKNFMRQMGGTVVNNGNNLSCARDMALYVKKTYEFSKSNPVLGGELINFLENTIFNDRLPVKLPKSVKIAHKIGNYEEAVNDIGIVYAGKPYIIAVMTKNADLSRVNNVIATISKMIYDYEQ